MRAEDTILKGEERIIISKQYEGEHPDPKTIGHSDFGYIQRLLKRQAEISFKAGMRDVVEWAENNFEPTIPMGMDYRKWCTFKKERGIE